MNIKEIQQKVDGIEYDFLRQNEHLGNNIILLTLGGSHAYGTNIETSDLDIRGVALNKPSELLGLSHFENFLNKETDTTIYSFNEMIKLLLNVNPNIIEMLGCNDEHYLYLSNEGRQLRENVDLFLTQKAVNSFGGYANQQLRRLQNALARDNYPQSEKEQHIMNSIINQMHTFETRYQPEFGMKLYLDDSIKEDFDKEIFIDINLKHYPLRDYHGIYSEMHNVVKDYGKLNHRNKKKDDLHLNKHSMHLVRLYLMATEILSGEGIHTNRVGRDLELLMQIRNGYFQNEDSSYRQEFFEMVNELETKMNYAVINSPLPKSPNMNKVEEFVMDINRGVILKNDK